MDGYFLGGRAIAGELVGKPPIAREFHRIPYNFLFFATFGGIHEIFSVMKAYVRRLSSMQKVYLCRQ